MAAPSMSRGRSRGYVPPEETKKKGGVGIWIALASLFLAVGAGIAWAMGAFSARTDARVVEVQQMAKELQSKMSDGGPKNEAEAKVFAESMTKVFQKAQELPEDLRGQAFRGMMRGGMMAGQQANMKSYFAAKPEDREKLLDEQIKREQMLQKAMMSAMAAGGGFMGGGPGGGGPGGGGPGGGGGGNAGGGPGGGAGAAQGQRSQWAANPEAFRKRMIDGTSPSQRSQFTEYRRAMDERRQKMGLGTGGWGGRGGR